MEDKVKEVKKSMYIVVGEIKLKSRMKWDKYFYIRLFNEEMKPQHIACGNTKWYSHYRKQSGSSSRS